MISGGNATVYVSNMDAAVQFYTETLGLTLTNRFGNHWATLETGRCYWTHGEAGLTIGLHPASAKHPAPGTAGGIGFGFDTYMPIEQVVARLNERGVRITSEIIRYEAGNCFMFVDLDGLPTYINEFPPNMLPETDLGANPNAEKQPSSRAGRRRTRHRLRVEYGRRRSVLQREARAHTDEPLWRSVRDGRGRKFHPRRSIRRRRERRILARRAR